MSLKLPDGFTRENILAVLDFLKGDGHGIFMADMPVFQALPKSFLEPLVVTHRSDGTHKGTIIDAQGNIRASMKGIYSLSLYQALAEKLRVTYMPAFGRGTEARRIDAAIRAALKEGE